MVVRSEWEPVEEGEEDLVVIELDRTDCLSGELNKDEILDWPLSQCMAVVEVEEPKLVVNDLNWVNSPNGIHVMRTNASITSAESAPDRSLRDLLEVKLKTNRLATCPEKPPLFDTITMDLPAKKPPIYHRASKMSSYRYHSGMAPNPLGDSVTNIQISNLHCSR